MKRIGITIFSILILALASVALSQPRPPHGGPAGAPPPPPSPEALANYLGLTTDQRAQWQAAHESFETAIEPLREKIEAIEPQMQQTSDACTLGTMMLTVRSAQDAIKAQHDALDAKLAATLTAEQKLKFDAFRAAAMAMRPPLKR
jgi:hypothetical protein